MDNVNAPASELLNSVITGSPALQQPPAGLQAGDGLVPVALLDIKHPWWQLNAQMWTDINVLYEGGAILKAQSDRFLMKRPKEVDDVYRSRLQRFTYQNILATCMGWYRSTLFRTDPEVDAKISGRALERPQPADPDTGKAAVEGDPEAETYDGFLKDSDNAGTTFVDQLREMFRIAALMKRCYVIIELPAEVQQAGNKGEQDAYMNPYLCIRDPRNAINWELDAYGNYNWILFKTETHVQQFLKPAVNVETWTYYDRHGFVVYERRADDPAAKDQKEPMARLVSAGPHATTDFENEDRTIGRVPVVVLEVPDGLWLGSRVFYQLLDHLNTENALQWGLLMGCLAMPVIISDSEYSPTLADGGFIQLEKGSTFTWAEPTGNSFKLSAERLASLREEIYRSFYLQAQGRSTAATPAAQSGYSKEMDMQPSKDILNEFGDIVRAVAQLILEIIATVLGDTTMEFDVRGLDFEHDPAIAEIVASQQLMNLGLQSDTFDKERQKTVVRRYGKDWNPALIEKCCNEIDLAPTKSEMEQKQEDQQDALMTAKIQQAQGGRGGNPLAALKTENAAERADSSAAAAD